MVAMPQERSHYHTCVDYTINALTESLYTKSHEQSQYVIRDQSKQVGLGIVTHTSAVRKTHLSGRMDLHNTNGTYIIR